MSTHDDFNDTGKRTLKMAIWADKKPGVCNNDICNKLLKSNDSYFIDLMADVDYCEQCGISLRYHRKKARQRQATLPITFNDVGK